MKYRYDDEFSKNYRNIPAAYHIYHAVSKLPMQDKNGNYIYTQPHNHAEFEVLLFLKGRGFATIGTEENVIPFSEGDILITNPFEVHTGVYLAGTPESQHLCVDFSVALLEQPLYSITQKLANDLLSQTVRSENLIAAGDPINAPLRAAFLEMFEAIRNEKQNGFQFLSAMFRFFDLLHESNRIHRTDQSPVKSSDMSFVKNVLGYINEHFTENISTRDIANALVYSKEHFCRLFKSNFSVSFTDYLTQYRVEKAKQLLASHSSSEVAELCGFSSQSNFSRVFKEAVGISPTEYRKFLLSES